MPEGRHLRCITTNKIYVNYPFVPISDLISLQSGITFDHSKSDSSISQMHWSLSSRLQLRVLTRAEKIIPRNSIIAEFASGVSTNCVWQGVTMNCVFRLLQKLSEYLSRYPFKEAIDEIN
jgi:hypothetical protein